MRNAFAVECHELSQDMTLALENVNPVFLETLFFFWLNASSPTFLRAIRLEFKGRRGGL